jgi:glutathione S-transferase
VLYRWSLRIGTPSVERYPHWTAHMRAMLARPAVVRAVEQEGLGLAEFDPQRG